jgi:hypothetical protein
MCLTGGNFRASAGLKLTVGADRVDRVECVAMIKCLALVAFCLAALATLSACSNDYYYDATFPGKQFDPGNQ